MSVESAGAISNFVSLAPDVLEAILQAGASAPSGDNLQPWRFSSRGEALFIHHDVTKDTSLYNVRGLASFIALGAALENIAIAASSHGYRADVTYSSDEHPDAVAQVKFSNSGEYDPLARVIPARCVNRKPYVNHPLAPDLISKLNEEARRFPRVEVRWIEEPIERKVLSKLVMQADRLLFENPHLHKQLFSCLRWTSEEVENTRDGLPVATLELGKLGAQAFHFLQSWRLVARLNRLGFSSLAAGRSGQLIRKSAAIGLVTVKEISTQAFVDGGRAFERLWLNATFQGLSFQPMTGFLFLQLRGILGDHEGLTRGQLELLASLREQLGLIFELGRSQVPAMMFRVGRSSSPTARTVRRSVAELFAG